jgi:hypothetical protein
MQLQIPHLANDTHSFITKCVCIFAAPAPYILPLMDGWLVAGPACCPLDQVPTFPAFPGHAATHGHDPHPLFENLCGVKNSEAVDPTDF